MSALYECKKIHANYTEEFLNLKVFSDNVYIGGKNSLVRLNSSLGIVLIKPMKGSNWLLTTYKIENKETILIACDYKGEYDSSCIGYSSNLSTVGGYTNGDIKIKKPQARYTTSTIGFENVLTIASSDCLKRSSHDPNCFAISHYHNILPFHDQGKYAVNYSNPNNIGVDFRTVVRNGNYTYFLFNLNHTISKLGKTCNGSITRALVNAYEDVPIYCSHNGVNFTKAQDLMFWNDDLLVVFTDGTASVICRFTNMFDNFEISRIERLKCSNRSLRNKYFYDPIVSLCYNEIMKICQLLANKTVSII